MIQLLVELVRVSKVLTTVFLISALSVPCVSYGAAAATCSVQKDGSTAIIDFGNRTVTIIGWEHQSALGSGRQNLLDGIEKAYGAALSNNCSSATDALNTHLLSHRDDEANSQKLIQSLLMVQSRAQIQTIGCELTPEEFADDQKNNIAIESALDVLAAKCPTQMPALVARFKAVTPGPVYMLAKSLPVSPNVIGVESRVAKQKALAVLEQMKVAPDLDPSALKPRAVQLLQQISQSLQSGTAVNDDKIAEAVSAQGPNPLGSVLKVNLDLANALIKTNSDRNQAVASNIAGTTGNFAMVIGKAHVDDLSGLIASSCKSQVASGVDVPNASIRQSTSGSR